MSAQRQALLEGTVAWFAENGVGDTSLRTLAAALGTSHRMLHYHFGGREGLLAAVIELVEHREREVLSHLLESHGDPFAAGAAFWRHVADTAQTFAPLFFELSSHAMFGHPHAASWRTWLVDGWEDVLTRMYRDAGVDPGPASALARLSLAQARGLLFELALTGDRATTDAAMDRFVEMLRSSLTVDGSVEKSG